MERKMLRRIVLGLLLVPTFAMAQNRIAVHDSKEIAAVTESFSGSFHTYLGVVALVHNCAHIVDQAADGNQSYGAICTVEIGKTEHTVMLCDDRSVGHFALNAATFVISDDAVAEFTKQNCYGG
jgi:hypothetical protein